MEEVIDVMFSIEVLLFDCVVLVSMFGRKVCSVCSMFFMLRFMLKF